MEKLLRDLFSEGAYHFRDHLVDWETVCHSKERGGLDMGRVVERNKALLMKWLWRFPKERQQLWYKVTESKFGLAPNQWTQGSQTEGLLEAYGKLSFHIMECFNILFLLKLVTEIVLDFRRMFGWAKLLVSVGPSLYRLSSFKNKPISNFSDNSSSMIGGSPSWNLHFSRNFDDREISQLQILLKLERVRICNSIEDRREWLVDSSGTFSCKSAFAHLTKDNSIPVCFPAKYLWKLTIPSKVEVFVWLLVLGKLSVCNVLQNRRRYQTLSPGCYVFYKKDSDCTDHLFLRCDFSSRLWCKILKSLGRVWVVPGFCSDLLGLGQGLHLNQKCGTPCKVAVAATLWAIWLEQNKRIFEDAEDSF